MNSCESAWVVMTSHGGGDDASVNGVFATRELALQHIVADLEMELDVDGWWHSSDETLFATCEEFSVVYKRSTQEIEEGLSSAREALAGGDESIAGLLMAPDELYEALNDVLHDWITCADPVARQAQLRRVLMEDNAYPSDSLARTLLRVRQENP